MIDIKGLQIVDTFEKNIIFKCFSRYEEKGSYPADTRYFIGIIYGNKKIYTTSFKLVSALRYLPGYKKSEDRKKKRSTENEKRKNKSSKLEVEDENNLSKSDTNDTESDSDPLIYDIIKKDKKEKTHFKQLFKESNNEEKEEDQLELESLKSLNEVFGPSQIVSMKKEFERMIEKNNIEIKDYIDDQIEKINTDKEGIKKDLFKTIRDNFKI
jgi:hypothetical protein